MRCLHNPNMLTSLSS
jgi:B-cell receptor-associated protein 31